MLNILAQESLAHEASEPESASEVTDFEIVLGRRQLASVLFVATVLVAVLSAVFYLAGKAASPKPAVAATAMAPAAVPAAPAPPVIAVAPPAPVIAVPPVQPPAQQSPLFGEPLSGAVYIQIGALEKGISQVLVEGLRTHGLAAFVASGPNDKIFRVLVGPLP